MAAKGSRLGDLGRSGGNWKKPEGVGPVKSLGLLAYGLEIDPCYCDVIVERWENLTGNKAKREVV